MIVRVLGDAQYDFPDGEVAALEQFEQRLDAAVEAGDETAYGETLQALISAVRESGSRLDAATLTPSDLTVPPEGSSIADVKELLSEGSIDTV